MPAQIIPPSPSFLASVCERVRFHPQLVPISNMARRTVTDKVLMAQYTGSPPFFEAQARFARAYRGPGGVGVSHSQNPDLQKCGNTQEHREADGSTFFSSEVVFSCSWTLVGRNVDTLLLDYAPRGGRIVAHPACAVFPSFLALQRDVLPARIIPERQACDFHPNSSRSQTWRARGARADAAVARGAGTVAAAQAGGGAGRCRGSCRARAL